MNINELKEQANIILDERNAESSYIEYKASSEFLGNILKTICAYGNNYYFNDNNFIFVGVEEENGDVKAIPKIPIKSIEEGRLEKTINAINSLRSYLSPNVKFDVVKNKYQNKWYVLVIVPRQGGGPFNVNEEALKHKAINIKPGRYIKTDYETRLAKVSEEYELIRKFSNYVYEEDINPLATLNDLNYDYMVEYLYKTSKRTISNGLSKLEIAKSLNLIDINDPNELRVYNFAVLMFSECPDKFIKNAYTEMIVDLYNNKRLMESREFHGPIWKQYQNIIDYIKNNYLNTITLRTENEALNTQVDNYPFTAIEELVANVIVHNDYQNINWIQIYITSEEINIINYNSPLAPLNIDDLNNKRIFNERHFINPKIRTMFKSLGIIESYGTGIGEAKKALEINNSPQLYYKSFRDNTQITSVVLKVNEEYYKIKQNKVKDTVIIEENNMKMIIQNSEYSDKIKKNLILIYEKLQNDIINNREICKMLGCSENSTNRLIKNMKNLNILEKATGKGKGQYKFKNR